MERREWGGKYTYVHSCKLVHSEEYYTSSRRYYHSCNRADMQTEYMRDGNWLRSGWLETKSWKCGRNAFWRLLVVLIRRWDIANDADNVADDVEDNVEDVEIMLDFLRIKSLFYRQTGPCTLSPVSFSCSQLKAMLFHAAMDFHPESPKLTTWISKLQDVAASHYQNISEGRMSLTIV